MSVTVEQVLVLVHSYCRYVEWRLVREMSRDCWTSRQRITRLLTRLSISQTTTSRQLSTLYVRMQSTRCTLCILTLWRWGSVLDSEAAHKHVPRCQTGHSWKTPLTHGRTSTQTDTETYRQTDRHTDRHVDVQTDRRTERQTDGQTDRHVDVQTDRRTRTDRQTHRQTCVHISASAADMKRRHLWSRHTGDDCSV